MKMFAADQSSERMSFEGRFARMARAEAEAD